MFQIILKELKPTVLSLLVLAFLTGFIYPAIVTGAAQVLFPHQANGSLIKSGDAIVGSELIGQPFSDPKYFWGRLSATNVTGSSSVSLAYNPGQSSGSNLGPTNPALIQAVKDRITALQDADKGNTEPVPVDLVTASGSGLDPHISPAAAQYQCARVAKARNLPVEKVQDQVTRSTEERQFGVLGEARVNVLKLNRSLDELK